MKTIAEIGWNHMGDMVLAKDMIYSACSSGTSFIKSQTFSVKRLKPGPWDKDGRTEIYKKAELSLDDHVKLMDYTSGLGGVFFTSVFSIEDAKLLLEAGSSMVKIPSFECINKELLEFCFDNFSHVIVSTGAHTLQELSILGNIACGEPVSLDVMHCVSSYPCSTANSDLGRINKIRKIPGLNWAILGYSDHCEGIDIATLAIPLIDRNGFIEKHFTIDKNLPGRDNKFAILPEELKTLNTRMAMFNSATMDHDNTMVKDCEVEARNLQVGRFNGGV